MNQREKAKKIAALVSMLAGFPAASQSSGELAAEAYVAVSDEFPAGTVEALARAYMRGQVPGQSLTFAPSTAEFATQLRVIQARDAAMLNRGPRVVAYPIGGKPPQGFVPLGPIKVNTGNGADVDTFKHAVPAKIGGADVE